MKRSIYIFALLVAFAIIIAGFFFLRYRGAPAEPPAADTEIGGGTQLPEAPPAATENTAETSPATETIDETAPPSALLPGGVKLAYLKPVRAFAVRADGSLLVLEPSGAVALIQGTTISALNPTPIINLRAAAFSADASKILVRFGEAAAPQAAVFDVKSKMWQPFPISIIDAAWSPANSRIAYLAEKNGGVVLGTLDLANPKAKPQELLRAGFLADATIAWPAPDRIFIAERASGAVPSAAWNFDIKKLTLSPFAAGQYGLSVQWDATHQTEGIAFTTEKGGRNGSLFLISPQGEIRERLAFFSLPEKCGFARRASSPASSGTASVSASALFCAVPRDAETLQVTPLPDSYRKRILFTSDNIYAINPASGDTRTLFSDAAQSFDATNLAAAGETLYFINRYDQKLYSIPIK